MKKLQIFSLLIGLSVMPITYLHAEVEGCGYGTKRTGENDLGITGSNVYLYAGPDEKTGRLINSAATEITKKKHYLSVDYSVTVYEECTKGKWSKIFVVTPDWLRRTHIGWIKTSSLKGKRVDADGIVIFTETDFYWDSTTLPYKNIIIKGVNKVHRENDRCKNISPVTAALSPSKSTKNNPMFYVTCDEAHNAFNVYFSKSDVERNIKLNAIQNIDREKALAECESYAKRKSTHPSTVRFSKFRDVSVRNLNSGKTELSSTFTSKNPFNLELKFDISCRFEGDKFISGVITEAH